MRLPPALRAPLALRTISGLASVPVAIWLIIEGGAPLAALVSLLLVAAVFELGRGMGLRRCDPILWLAATGAAAMTAVSLTREIPSVWPFTAAALAIVAAPALQELLREWRLSAAIRRADPGPVHQTDSDFFAALCSRSAAGLAALVYIGWLGSFFLLLRELPHGEEWLLLAVFSVMATDTGAFALGRTLGRRPLARRLSPRKTVEGGIGGLLAGFAAVLLISLLPDLDVALWKMVLLGLALPLIATTGDLSQSVVKRALDVKDFSRVVPGHGGVLDRLDSLLFGVPTVYFFVRWIVI